MKTMVAAIGVGSMRETWTREERTTDIVTGSYLVALLTLVMLFPFRFGDPSVLVLRLGIVLSGFVVALALTLRLLSGTPRALARISVYAAVLMYLFDEMQFFQQLLFTGWFDGEVLRAEAWMFGGNVVANLQPWIHPWVTEGLMFTYVIYMPLLPILAYVVYRSAGGRALGDYLLNLSLIFLACFAGYVVFPVASPMHYAPDQFDVPLTGGLWTWCGEWLRQNHHYPGGSVPSAHCAAATGMLIMLYRHYRKGFYVALPIFLLLYAATVYGRFHYVTDAVTGILTAALVLRYAPALVALLNPLEGLARGSSSVPKKAPSPVFGEFSTNSSIPEHDTILTNGRPVSDSSPS